MTQSGDVAFCECVWELSCSGKGPRGLRGLSMGCARNGMLYTEPSQGAGGDRDKRVPGVTTVRLKGLPQRVLVSVLHR